MYNPYSLLGDDDPANPPVGGIIPSRQPITSPAPLPVPAPHAAPTPQVVAQQPQSFLGRIHDAMQNMVVPDAPKGYEGLLSSSEIRGARPGLMQSLIGTPDAPSASDRYKHNLDEIVARKQATSGILAQQEAAQRQHDLILNRAKIQQQLGAPPPDEAGFADYMRKAYGLYNSIGDMESIGHISDVMKEITAHAGNKATEHDMGDRIGVFDENGRLVRTYARGASPVNSDTKAARDSSEALRQETAAREAANSNFQHETRLTDDFRSEIKPVSDATKALGTIYSLKDAALAGDPMAQQSLLTSYIKLQHPSATVRPSEIHNYANLLGASDKVARAIQNFKEGAALGTPQIQQILQEVAGLHRSWQNSYKSTRKVYEQRAKNWQVNPRALMDPFAALPVPGGTVPVSPAINPLMRK
jgi:hypothetical protein